MIHQKKSFGMAVRIQNGRPSSENADYPIAKFTLSGESVSESNRSHSV